MSRILIILFLFNLIPQNVFAEETGILTQCEIIIDDFATGIKPAWKNKSFRGITDYIWTKENDKGFMKATSQGTASSLYYKIEYDIMQYPYIAWQWKVDKIPASGDATKKSFDDYGARLYVVFPSLAFWNTKTINYIWANKLPKEEMIPSAYAENSIMISVESGNSETGKWITETRNVHEDYKRSFGTEPPIVGGIAIMTDSDDTGESAIANYGPIAVCSQAPRN